MEIRLGIPNPWQLPFFPGHVMRTSWPGWASVLIFTVSAAWDYVTIVLWLWDDPTAHVCTAGPQMVVLFGETVEPLGSGAWLEKVAHQEQALGLYGPILPLRGHRCNMPASCFWSHAFPACHHVLLSTVMDWSLLWAQKTLSSFKFHLLTYFITPRESNSITIKTT